MATTAATNYIVTMTIRHCSDAVPTTYGVYSTREEAEASIPYHQTRYVRDMLLAELDCHAVTDESVSDIAQNFSMDPEDVRKLLTTDVVIGKGGF